MKECIYTGIEEWVLGKESRRVSCILWHDFFVIFVQKAIMTDSRCVSPANTPALFTLVYWRQIICKVTPSTISLLLQTNRFMQSTWRNSLEDLFVWKQLLTVWSPDNKHTRNMYSNWRKFIYIQSHHHEFSADHHHNHHNRLHVLHFKVMTKWDWD